LNICTKENNSMATETTYERGPKRPVTQKGALPFEGLIATLEPSGILRTAPFIDRLKEKNQEIDGAPDYAVESPAGIIYSWAAGCVLIGAPEGATEQRTAERLAHVVRVSPALIGVYEMLESYPVSLDVNDKSKLLKPSGERTVYAPAAC
jgi:hypothetical protein